MRDLMVPTSRADPGRAARPGPVVVDDSAAVVAEFGDVMVQLGTAVENDRLDREMQRLQTDMMRGMNDLRLETQQIGSPDAAELTWSDGLVNLRAGFDLPGEDGRARLDPKNRERFDLAFDDLSGRHAFSLGRRVFKLREVERQVNAVAQAEAATESYVTAPDDVTQAEIADWMFQGIDGRVASGEIPPELAEQLKDEWLDQADTARAISEVDADDLAQFGEEVQDDAAEIQEWIAGNSEARRLTLARNYSPDSPQAVEEMYEELYELFQRDEGEQHDYVNRVVERANARFRAEAERPIYYASGQITQDGLEASARRTIAEFRAGRIDDETYGRQAKLIRELMMSYYDG